MRVFGIDASRALSDTPTGTEYYSRALIDALLRLDAPCTFRLYTRARPAPDFFPPTRNYEIRAMPLPRLWTHLRLSYEMLTRPPDALFIPAHVVPPIHPRHTLVTVHDLGYLHFPQAHPTLARRYLDLTTRWNVSAARMVIADSQATCNDLVRFYRVRREKIRVVYPAYNAHVFKPVRDPEQIARVCARYQIARPYLLSVGTLQPRKNYARLIEAVARLPGEYPLVIVGKKGWMFEPLFARVQALGLSARVRFLDYVELNDLPVLYAGAQLAILPSLYEGFGFPALEAQACETALVCSHASSLPEVAGDGAEYFNPLNVEAMTQAMVRVLNDETHRRELVERGRANVKRFSWEHTARQIMDLVKWDTLRSERSNG